MAERREKGEGQLLTVKILDFARKDVGDITESFLGGRGRNPRLFSVPKIVAASWEHLAYFAFRTLGTAEVTSFHFLSFLLRNSKPNSCPTICCRGRVLTDPFFLVSLLLILSYSFAKIKKKMNLNTL